MLHLDPDQIENIKAAARVGACIGVIALLARVIYFQIFERRQSND